MHNGSVFLFHHGNQTIMPCQCISFHYFTHYVSIDYNDVPGTHFYLVLGQGMVEAKNEISH